MLRYVIIVAGGTGQRMKSEIPKQFLELNGFPILMHTIRNYHSADPSINIIVVLPADEISSWEQLCTKHGFDLEHATVAGGRTRFHSVQNGLNTITDNDSVVAIHDGVRPFTSKETILNSFEVALEKGSAVTCVSMTSSVRQTSEDGKSLPLNRDTIKVIQTPQTFRTADLKIAYNIQYNESFTDDATVFESAGNVIELIEGDQKNIKITTPEDLELAKILSK